MNWRNLLRGASLVLALALSPSTVIEPVFAQSGCSSIRTGAVLTAAQWQACFSGKQDYLGSLTAIPLNTRNIFYGVSNVAVATLPTAVFDDTFCATRGALLSRQVASWACLGVGTAGQAFVSAGAGADPAFGTLGVAGGGTGAATLTIHGMLIGQGTSAITSLPCAVGQVIQWPTGTGADPACTSTPQLGVNGGTAGQIKLNGSTSGSVTLVAAAAPGTPSFQLPIAGVTVQRFTSGTAATYTPAANTIRIRVRMIGGGGGGGAQATNNGTTGNDSSFESWTAKGGSGGPNGGASTAGGAGGNSGVDGTGTLVVRQNGETGAASSNGALATGAMGGGSPFLGGAGARSASGATGGAGRTNSGGGGGGGHTDGTAAGGGGGGGEYVEFWMTAAQVGASITYTVGASAAGGGAGTVAGGVSGAGIILVEEFYW